MLPNVVGHRSDHNLCMWALSHLLPTFITLNSPTSAFFISLFFLYVSPICHQSSRDWRDHAEWWKMSNSSQQQTRLYCKIEIAFSSLTKAVFNAADVHDIIIKDSLNYHWITIDFSHLNSTNSASSLLDFSLFVRRRDAFM